MIESLDIVDKLVYGIGGIIIFGMIIFYFGMKKAEENKK
jgi:hypothetical protein